MRPSSFLLAACLFITGSLASALLATEPVPQGLSVSISFAPDTSNPDAYSCTAEVTDLASGTLLGKPVIHALKGESGKVQIGDDNSSLVLDIALNKAGNYGSYTVTQTRSGKIVGLQKGAISIR